MKIPKRIQPLVDDGLVEDVTRQLMSGKEASVFVVRADGDVRCAKVYKDANNRSFRQRADYEEGRRGRNSRRARAMAKRSKFGREQLDESWQNAEVDAIYTLARAGVRVPRPHVFSDGVLVMELVVDEHGNAAPRLNDVSFTAEEARAHHAFMMEQVVRMLCAGLIHGDLSEYNVLVDPDGPVVIDFPQAVNAAGNNNARAMLLRDVENMTAYFSRFAPELAATRHGQEIWALYERGELHPEVTLTGRFKEDTALADVDGVLRDIEDARDEHLRRTGRKVVDVKPSPERAKAKPRPESRRKPRSDAGRSQVPEGGRRSSAAADPSRKPGNTAATEGDAPPKKRRRRRRKPPGGTPANGGGTRQADPRPRQQQAGGTPSGSGSGRGARDAPAEPKSSDSPKAPRRRRRRRRREPQSE